MPVKDDDVLNVLNENTQNNNYQEDIIAPNEDELAVLNANTQQISQPPVQAKPNKFGVALNEEEENARSEGYLQQESGVIRSNYDDVQALGGEDNLFKPSALSQSGSLGKTPGQITEEEEPLDESKEEIYQSILGITQYSDLRKMCGLKDDESFTDYYRRTKYIPKGYEKTARLLMAEERVKKLYASYKTGDLGYADFLYRAYGEDILKSQGVDVKSTLYWYNKAKNHDFTNPLDSDTYLSDVLSMAAQKFEAETWYETVTTEKLNENALVWASGGEVTAENLKELFGEQFTAITEHFENEEEFIKLYKAGYIDMSMFNPFIDIDGDKVYDYYFATDGKLYACEGSSGQGKNVCKVYYEDETDENGYKKVDRVNTGGLFGTSEFGENVESFLGSFFSVFTGLIDLGAQFVGLVGHWCGNDDIAINWNAFKNNNLLFGGTNTKDFESFQADESDDWFRAISSAAGTITGMIASAGLTGVVNRAATAAAKAAEGAGKLAQIGAGTMKAIAFTTRTYSGLRGGNVTTIIPELAKHTMANRLVTASALAIRDGVSTANKLIIQNKILGEDQRISEGEIIGRTFGNIILNTAVSFGLRQIGDSGVTDFFKGEKAYEEGVQKGIQALSEKATDEVVGEFSNQLGAGTVRTIGSTLLGKTINTVADIVENVVTQTNTAVLSSPGSDYFQSMGHLVTNPSFILTNLYIAKQDMGFKLFGKDENGTRVFLPRTEINYQKAAISSIKNIDETYKTVMSKLNDKYVELVKTNPEQADAVMKGIIKPAEEIYIGKKDETTVQSTLKALTWLCKQTADIPVTSLNFEQDELRRLNVDEKQSGPVRALVLAHMKEGAVEKIIAKASYGLSYYQKAYNQINKANIDIMKGQLNMREVFEQARQNFEDNAEKVVGKRQYRFDVNAFKNDQELQAAIEEAAPKLYEHLNKTSKSEIIVAEKQYNDIKKYLESKSDEASKSRFMKIASLQQENLVGTGKKKETLINQLNAAFGIGGLNVRMHESMLRGFALTKEQRAADFEKFNNEDFDSDFNKLFNVQHVENESNGQLRKELLDLCQNEQIIKFVESLGYKDVKTYLMSSNILTVNGTAVNELRQDPKLQTMVRCLDVLSSMRLIDTIKFNDNGANKELYVIPYDNDVFSSLMKTDAVSSALRSTYVLATAQDVDQTKAAANVLVNVLLDFDARIAQGKDATTYVKDYHLNEKVIEEDDEGKVIKDIHNYNIDFLGSEQYKDGAEKLLSTTLAQLTLHSAITRTQLVKILNDLEIDYNQIDTSGNVENILGVKQYLKAYEATNTMTEFVLKYEGKSKVSQTDLKSFDEAKKQLLNNKEIVQQLIEDKIISNNFLKRIEDVNSFIDGRLGEIRENSEFESLVRSLKENYHLAEYSEDDVIKLLDYIGVDNDDVKKDLINDVLLVSKFYAGTQRYNKKDLIIVNLSRLETKEAHKIIRRLDSESIQQSFRDNGKAVRSLEKELQRTNLGTLQRLTELQKNCPTGVLTFDRNNEQDLSTFKSMMKHLGYEDNEINGMISSNTSRLPGVSYTTESSLGLEFILQKEKYDELMSKSKAITEENSVKIESKKPIDIKTSFMDKFGILLNEEQIKNLDYDKMASMFEFEQSPDGSIKMVSLKKLSEAHLKLGKAASKLDKIVKQVFSNSYNDVFASEDMKELNNAILIQRIIDAAKQFNANKISGDTETKLYSYKVSKEQWNGISKATKALYEVHGIEQEDGMIQVVVNGINEKNWNIKYFLKHFADQDGIDMHGIFLVPYTEFYNALTTLPEVTYGYDTVEVQNLNTTGANFLEYIRTQMDDTFDDLEYFYNFITEQKIKIGDLDSEESIKNNFVDIVKTSLLKQNEETIKTLKEKDLSNEAIEIIFDRNKLEVLAKAVQNNMNGYTNLGIDSDGKTIISKLDVEKIAKDSGFDVNDVSSILELLKTYTPNEVYDDDIILVRHSNPFSDVASMIRYEGTKTGKVFISMDDIRMLTKEQFEILEKLGLVTPELKEKLSLIGKFEDGKFKTLGESDTQYTSQRTTYEIGKETSNILSNGAAFIDNEDTRKLMLGFLERSQNRSIVRNNETFFDKLSSMNLDRPINEWLAEKLNVYTTTSVANPGSVFVANAENNLAVGEILNSIASLSGALVDHEFKDGSLLQLPQDVATSLAMKIYFNTTGTDMSSSYNRYTLVYKDENDEWHIENIGENFENKLYESGSLGRGLAKAGLLTGKLKSKEIYLFNASKNVMSASAGSYGENIQVMNLNDDNLDMLRSIVFRNAIQHMRERGYNIDLNKISNERLADKIAKELGACVSKSEIRRIYTESAKTRILDSLNKNLSGLNETERQVYIDIVNRIVDSTLETTESLNSRSALLTLNEQAQLELDKYKGQISEANLKRLRDEANLMLSNVYDAFTFMINKNSIPSDVKSKLSSIKTLAEDELVNIKDGTNFLKIAHELKTDDSDAKYIELKQAINKLPEEERLDAIASVLKVKFLNETKGKYLQYALLGSKEYLDNLAKTYQEEEGIQKVQSSLYEDIYKFLNKVGYPQYYSEGLRDSLFEKLTSIGSRSLESLWDEGTESFRNSYKVLSATATSDLIKELVADRSAVFASDEAAYIRKVMYQEYNQLLPFESQRNMIEWLNGMDENNISNLVNFRTNLAMFVEKNPDGITDKTWSDANEKLNELYVTYLNKHNLKPREFSQEELLKLPAEELSRLANLYGVLTPREHASSDDVAKYCNEFAKDPNRINELKFYIKDREDTQKLNEAFSSFARLTNIDSLDDDVRNMIIDQSAAMLVGDFSKAFSDQASRKFKIDIKGPVYSYGKRMSYLDEQVNNIMDSDVISRKWTMVSGVNAGDDVELDNGTSEPLSSTDIGMTKKYFESLVGTTVEAYRESVGANPNDDLYVEIYRNPGIGVNVINTYKVKLIDNKYNDILLTQDIFSAYHGGDFDSDKIIVLKPDKQTQLSGKDNLGVSTKVWSIADKLISLTKSMHVKSDQEIISEFEKKYSNMEAFSLFNLLERKRADRLDTPEWNAAYEDAKEQKLITEISEEDKTKYSTLKPNEKNETLVYSDYLLKDDAKGNELVRRLALDTKFYIDEILRVKDSSTGFASKALKPILPGIEKKLNKDAEFFTYNQFNLSKNTKAKLQSLVSTQEGLNQVVNSLKESVAETFDEKISSTINKFLNKSIVDVSQDKSAEENVTKIIDAIRLAEFLYRDSNEYRESFNKLVQSRIDSINDSELKQKVKTLKEYAELVKAEPLLDQDGKPLNISTESIDKASHNDLLNYQYGYIKSLEPVFEQQRYAASANDTSISTRIINMIRSQELNMTDDSKAEYIDGVDSKNYIPASVFIAAGSNSVLKDLAADTFNLLDNRFTVSQLEGRDINLSNLTKNDINNLSLAWKSGKHPTFSINNDFVIKHNEQILSVKMKNGDTLSFEQMIDKDGDLLINPIDIKAINILKTHGAKRNKIAIVNSGQGKGTIAVASRINHFDLDGDIQALSEFIENNKEIFNTLKTIIETKSTQLKNVKSLPKDAIDNVKSKLEELNSIYKQFAELKAKYDDEKLAFDVKQIASGDLTWDELSEEYDDASSKEQSRIRGLHAKIKNKYISKFDTINNKISELDNDLDGLYKDYGSENKKLSDLFKIINTHKESVQSARKAREQYNFFFGEKIKNIKDKEQMILFERLQTMGVKDEVIDQYLSHLDELDKKDKENYELRHEKTHLAQEEVRRLNKEFKEIAAVGASNLLDIKKQGLTSDDYEITYYDQFMNEVDDPAQAAFTKLTARWYFPEGNSFWNQDVKQKPLDTISFNNDRTNSDSIVKWQGNYYTKRDNGDGTYSYYYDSKKANEISRIINMKNTSWAGQANATRVFNVLLANLLYDNCEAIKSVVPNKNTLLKTMLDGTLTASSTGRKIIASIFDKMSDDEIKTLYTSNNPTTKYLLSMITKMMPPLNAVDAEEFNASLKLESKNKAKEISRNKTNLYYYTKAEGKILSGQSHLNGSQKTEDGYPYMDVTDGYYPLSVFVRDLIKLENGNKYDWLFSTSMLNSLTLRKILNFANGDSGTMADLFKSHSLMDAIAYQRKTSALQGASDIKSGDAPAASKTITPEQKVIGQYADVKDNILSLTDANTGNGLFDDDTYNQFIEGRYSDKLNDSTYDKQPYEQRHSFNNLIYGADTGMFHNKVGKAAALSVRPDDIVRELGIRRLRMDDSGNISFMSNSDGYRGTIGGYYDNILGQTDTNNFRDPLITNIRNKVSSIENYKDKYIMTNEDETEESLKQISNAVSEINRDEDDIQKINTLNTDELNYLKGNMVDGQVSEKYNVNEKYERVISNLKTSKQIAEFDTDLLASSKIKQAGMDRAVVGYNANIKGYRNQLLGNEFLQVGNILNSSKQYRDGFNEYIKLKNLTSSLNYCNERLSNKFISQESIDYYTNIKAEIFKELSIENEETIPNVQATIDRYAKVYSGVESLIDTICNRVYAAQKGFCNATGQTCPSRERFFLPVKAATDETSLGASKHNSSLLFAGTAKYTSNPFSIRKETTGLNPADAYKEFDALTNITTVANEVGKLQALLTYREEAKANGAMSNALSFEKTCELIGSKLTVSEMNQYGSRDMSGTEIKGYQHFASAAQNILGIYFSGNRDALSSCGFYASAYNQIYQKAILPLREAYGDISFGNLLSVAMSNPQDQIVDKALTAYSFMMDAVGKITTIQMERGEKTTLTDTIYEEITKFAEDNNLVIVDQFGRKYDKDLSQFKALSPYTVDDYVFRATHGGLASEGTYEQNVALDALRGDLYFMDPTVAKHTQEMFYTRDPSTVKKVTNVMKNVATKLIMANPAKFVSRMLNFSMFDLNSSIMTGDFGMLKKLPQMTKDISGYLQSNGEYCPESLKEFINITGIDPLKDQTFIGESLTPSKVPYFNFVKKQFTAQHLANRYALWLDIKEKLGDDCNVDKIIPMLGNSYYLKDQLKDMANNMRQSVDGLERQSASSRIAALVVSNQYGTYGDMPGIAGSLSKHGFMFTTFPAALLRFARNEVRSGATAIKEIFTGTADTNTLKYLGRQVGSLVSLAAITAVLQILPALLNSDDEEEKKEKIKEIIKNDTSLDLFQSLLLDDQVYNTSTVWNPFYGVKKIVADPIIKSIEEKKENDASALEVVGNSLAKYFNENVWNRLNPAITLIPNAALPQNALTNPYGNQGTDFFDNLSRKALSFSLGTNGSNAFINTIQSGRYDVDSNFVETLGHGFENALREELGNSKSYKSSWKNYNSALTIIYDYAKGKDKTTYDPTSETFDKDYSSGLKAKLKNAMRIKSSPTVIYGIIHEALNSHVSKEEIRNAIRAVSVRVQISKLVNQDEFFDSLSQKEYNTIKSALAYEDSIFPNLDELYDESVSAIIDKNTKEKMEHPTFKYVGGSLKTYGYNYPTYRSSTYKYNGKNYYHNNLNNWNTNTYNRNRYRNQIINPTDVYNQSRQRIAYGTSKDIWGNETRHYTDGTEYTVRQQGVPLLGGNK